MGSKHVRIPLTQGKFTVIDAADLGKVDDLKWYAHTPDGGKLFYAVSQRSRTEGGKAIRMHRLILNAPPGSEVDHINGDGLDNRRINLRFCTRSQNLQNMRRKKIGTSSKFKGVYFCPDTGRWRANIQINHERRFLGRYDSEIEAAIAYDEAAISYFGGFARPNILPNPMRV